MQIILTVLSGYLETSHKWRRVIGHLKKMQKNIMDVRLIEESRQTESVSCIFIFK